MAQMSASARINRMLAGVLPSAFGETVRFLSPDAGVTAPRGFESQWAPLSADGKPLAEQSWAEESELHNMTALVILVGEAGLEQRSAVRQLAAHLHQHPLAAPPVFFVPLFGSNMQTWAHELIKTSAVDFVIWGEPAGYALALEVQAKLRQVAVQVDRLHEQLDKRSDVAELKEQLLSSVDFMRWQYLRTRLFHALPPTRDDVEWNGTVAGFQLGHKISRGAFGYVYAASRQVPPEVQGDVGAADRSEHAGMLVIEKRGGIQNVGDLSMINTFLTVVSILSNAPHRNVARLLEVCASPTRVYVGLEFAGPWTLFSRLCQRDAPVNGAQPVALSTAVMQSIAAQTSAAVCHLHLAADVCHRDIKPENISVDEAADGRVDVKLFGFELATVQHAGQCCKRACGTIPFSAPEVILAASEGHDGKAADMWSLGVLLVELACGLRCVEKALPVLHGASSADTSGRAAQIKSGRSRAALPSSMTALAVQDAIRNPTFDPGLLQTAKPEASGLEPWLSAVTTALLVAEPARRINAAALQPTVTD